jgi:hypothetical protein
MALYFLKEEKDLPASPPTHDAEHVRGERSRRIIPIMAVLAVLLAGLVEASGLLRPRESLLPGLIGIPSPARARTVFLSLPDGRDGADPMEVALLLRGLSMLHPSVILLAPEHPASGDAARFVEGVKGQLAEKGIRLVEAVRPSPESLWRPVPLSRYLPPGISDRKESLPVIPGTAPAEGTLRYIQEPPPKPGNLSLLSVTATGELAGSLWWEGLMQGQPNAPAWLLADHLLLLPNHAPLPSAGGSLSTPRVPALLRTVTSDDFLLRMEERERGGISPDFDSLWEDAVVVVGPSSMQRGAADLASLRGTTILGAFTLAAQAIIMVLLSGIVLILFFLPKIPALSLTAFLLLTGILGSWWSLRQGILPPILPWAAAITSAVTLCLIRKPGPG